MKVGKFINYILDADVAAWTINNILYKVPNEKAMTATAEIADSFPNMGMSVSELSSYETLKDVGSAAKLYAKTVSYILSD